MKQRNKRFLKSWRPLLLTWAAWSVFGVLAMQSVAWLDTEAQMDRISLSEPVESFIDPTTATLVFASPATFTTGVEFETATTSRYLFTVSHEGSGTITTVRGLDLRTARQIGAGASTSSLLR